MSITFPAVSITPIVTPKQTKQPSTAAKDRKSGSSTHPIAQTTKHSTNCVLPPTLSSRFPDSKAAMNWPTLNAEISAP